MSESRTRCPVCNRLFARERAWQRYDSPECRKMAFALRERERVRAEVLAELEVTYKANPLLRPAKRERVELKGEKA